MKVFYRDNGEKYYVKKKWSKALSFFERYYLIDSDTKEINNMHHLSTGVCWRNDNNMVKNDKNMCF